MLSRTWIAVARTRPSRLLTLLGVVAVSSTVWLQAGSLSAQIAIVRIEGPAMVDAPAVRVETPTPATTPSAPTSLPPGPTLPPGVELTFGFDATPPSATWQRPTIFAPTNDPVYGTPVRRLTSAEGTRFDRNTYSRRQAENADGSSFMTYHGSATYRVYERASGSLVRELDVHPDGEPQWHPTDPDLIRHIAGSNASVGDLALYETVVSSGATRPVADLTERVRSGFPDAAYLADRAEGSPSANGHRWAWIVHDAAEQPIAVVSYDLSVDQVLGIAPIESGGVGPLDWVSMSPTGSYVVSGYGDATIVYDADMSNGRRINNKADHSDIALDLHGGDSYVYIDFSAGPDAGWLVAVALDTLERTRIFDLYDDANTSVHISGKGFERPGWVVVSTYNCKVPGAWSCDKVFAVELAGEHRVVNLAHTYNCGHGYWTETHAVVNRSFTRVYFNSDAGSCGIDAEVYELAIPTLPN